MPETVVVAIIVSIASPVLLEFFRASLNKRSKADEDTRTKIAVLETRVTDLQAANTKQLIEIGILQERNRTQEKEIDTLKGQIAERDSRIHDLEMHVDTLTAKRGVKK